MIAHAQSSVELAHSFVGEINNIILFPLITLLTVIALVVFLWGGFQYVYNANNDGKRAEGAKHLLWGTIGLLVMISAFSILTIAANTFGIDVDDYSRTETGASPFAPTTSPRPQAMPTGVAPVGGASLSPGQTTNPAGSQSVAGAATTEDLQGMVIADYEANTKVHPDFYMRDVRAMTTDIDGVDRRSEIETAHIRGYISDATRDALIGALDQ